MTRHGGARGRMRRLLAAAAVLAVASTASAQVTISGGLDWGGGYDVGVSTAQLRTNAPGASPPPFTWFTVDSQMAGSLGGQVRVGYAITPRLTVEGAAALSRRRIAFDVTGDNETSFQSLEGESVHHYLFEGTAMWHLPLARYPKVVPFASGGAGYLRQLHQDRTLVETGQVYHAGGGLQYWLRGRPDSARGLGVRGDVRMNIRHSGIDFENATRVFPSLSLLLFVGL
jgi:hypothetical protein